MYYHFIATLTDLAPNTEYVYVVPGIIAEADDK